MTEVWDNVFGIVRVILVEVECFFFGINFPKNKGSTTTGSVPVTFSTVMLCFNEKYSSLQMDFIKDLSENT